MFTSFLVFPVGFTEERCKPQGGPSLSCISFRLRLHPLLDNAQTHLNVHLQSCGQLNVAPGPPRSPSTLCDVCDDVPLCVAPVS